MDIRDTAGRKIKVAHVITRLTLGGAQENTLLTVLGLMRRPGYEVDLIAGANDVGEGPLPLPPGAGAPRIVTVPEMRRHMSPADAAVALVKLTRLLRTGGYDVVHTHMTQAGVLGRVAAWRAGTPVVVHTLHGPAFHARQPWYVREAIIRLKRTLARRTDHVISVSQRLADEMVARRIVPADRISTIYSGMELEWFMGAGADRAEVRAALGIPPDAPVAGTVARLVPLKGHGLLLDAIPELVRRVPDARVLLVGGGPLREVLEARVRTLGMERHVVFAGEVPRERVPAMIGALDVLVHTSEREGLARVLPQALAAGRPCVALDLDGAPEVVIPGRTGFLVRPGDAPGLAEAVASLLRDGDARRRMGEAGRRLVSPRWHARTMVDEIAALYERLLRERGRETAGQTAR
ncbi:MAG TPA: glycosyltransferase family 4 protein [Longimicrobium sp.]|nr:glycosyltransferase family 4 protein [Longimicrobium sp.]